MSTYKNEVDLKIIRHSEFEIVFLIPWDKAMLMPHDKIEIGVLQGTRGVNAGFPVNVFYDIQEIEYVQGVHEFEHNAPPTHNKVTAKVIRHES